MTELSILDGAADGMEAQRNALAVFAHNVAAAQAAPPGGTFERLVPQFVTGPEADAAGVDEADEGETDRPALRLSGTSRERVTGDALTEMVAMLDAQRAYEADASVFDLGKRLSERALELERLP